jgi:hypothetical protein
MLARTRAAATAAAVLAWLLLSACSHPASPAPERVTMAYCGSGPQARPQVLEIVCGTSDITADRLAWSSWGGQIATAVGTAVVDTCAYEDCHTGSYTSVPIVLVASEIVRCGRSTQAYTRLQYVFVGGSPFSGLPANGVDFSHFIAAPDRPSPPANQVVSLTC